MSRFAFKSQLARLVRRRSQEANLSIAGECGRALSIKPLPPDICKPVITKLEPGVIVEASSDFDWVMVAIVSQLRAAELSERLQQAREVMTRAITHPDDVEFVVNFLYPEPIGCPKL